MELERITQKTFLERIRHRFSGWLMPLVAAGSFAASSCSNNDEVGASGGGQGGNCIHDSDCPGDEVCDNYNCTSPTSRGCDKQCVSIKTGKVSDYSCSEDWECGVIDHYQECKPVCVGSPGSSSSDFQTDKPSAPATKVFQKSYTADLLSVSDSLLEFSADSVYAQKLHQGDVIAAGVSDKAPYGLLRKVSSTQTSGNKIVVKTTPATLEDAIEKGSFSGSIALTQDFGQTSGALSGFGQKQGASSADLFNLDIDFDNKDLYQGIVTLDGGLTANVGMEFDLDLDYFKIKKVRYSIVGEEELNLKLTADLKSEIHKESKPIEPIKFAPVTFFIGPVPVVVVPKLTVTFGVDAGGEVAAESSLTQTLDLEVGIEYASGAWKPIKTVNKDFSFDPPLITVANGMVEVYTKPELGVDLYDVAGPYVRVRASSKAEMDVTANPWWEISAGLEVLVGADFTVFGKSLASFEKKAHATSKVLASADGGCGDGECNYLENKKNCAEDCASEAACTPKSYKDCVGNYYVAWFDSCGNMGDVTQDCTGKEVCQDGSCVTPESTCTSQADTTCYDGDIMWVNSCGNMEYLLAEDCQSNGLVCDDSSGTAECVSDQGCNPAAGCNEPDCVFYDDFNGSTLDTECKWDISKLKKYSLSGGILKMDATSESQYLSGKLNFKEETFDALEVRWRISGAQGFFAGLVSWDNFSMQYDPLFDEINLECPFNDSTISTPTSLNEWHTSKLVMKTGGEYSTEMNMEYFLDGILKKTVLDCKGNNPDYLYVVSLGCNTIYNPENKPLVCEIDYIKSEKN
ncbi:hypothetical protein HYX14_01710 [Candidatus Woesearchaeota archaeon]|nr:hypothetical protein [Candidatus Woesearchaeota archaeon]